HPQASSFESAARDGFPLGAGLRKDAEKLEQDCGGRHAGDAAGVEGRRDLDEIGADEIEAPQIADQTLGFKCREPARLRRPRPWRIDWIERVDIEGEIGGAAADNLSRLQMASTTCSGATAAAMPRSGCSTAWSYRPGSHGHVFGNKVIFQPATEIMMERALARWVRSS